MMLGLTVRKGKAQLVVCDVSGRLVWTAISGRQEWAQGKHLALLQIIHGSTAAQRTELPDIPGTNTLKASWFVLVKCGSAVVGAIKCNLQAFAKSRL